MPVRLIVLGCALLASLSASANTFVLPPPDIDVVGEIRVVHARREEDLLDIARANGIGYNQIIQANPGVDRWLPGEGTEVVLPNRHILPDAPRDGIVLNLPEMRLYYYPKPRPGEKPVVITHPVSVGRMDWKTPLGKTSVVSKQKDPTWTPPATIKAEHAANGDFLPDVVPAGPDNPLGAYALRLGVSGYLIHGTNKPFGIGMRVTHGCIRMYPEDIETMFQQVPVGTPVYIVNQRVKAGWLAGTLFMEAHAPLEEEEIPSEAATLEDAMHVIDKKTGGNDDEVDREAVTTAIEQARGLVVSITH